MMPIMHFAISPWTRLAFWLALPVVSQVILRFGRRSLGTYTAAIAAIVPGIVFLVAGVLMSPLRTMHDGRLVLVPWALMALVVTYAALRRYLHWRDVRRVVAVCRAPRGRLARAAQRCGVAVREMPTESPICMLVGVRRPVAIVSSGTVRACSDSELDAALWHERAHARHHDILIATVMEFVSDFAAFAPTRAFKEAYRQSRELAADAEASRQASPTALAAALLALAKQSPVPQVGLAFADVGTLRSRLSRLLGEAEPLPSHEWRVGAVVALASGLALAFAPLAYGAGLHAVMPHIELVHHPVSTTSAIAQRHFDEGLLHLYGYNYGAAHGAFQQALDADSGLAMAYWGIALADGPNVNMPSDSGREADALVALAKARTLAVSATAAERDLIDALGARYSTAPGADYRALERSYAAAMQRVAHAHPGDLDAMTLYGEALLNVMDPHEIYGPVDTTMAKAVTAVFDSVLRRNPRHVGARHYHIHAVEDVDPPAGLASADFLQALTLAPEESHLAHMPSHIYMRIGRFEDAIRANRRALELSAAAPHVPMPAMTGMHMGGFPQMHVLSNLLYGLFTLGRQKEAVEAVAQAPAQAKITIGVRFGDWSGVYATPSTGVSTPRYHLAHGLAAAALGKTDEARADITPGRTLDSLLIEAAIARSERHAEAEVAALVAATRLREVGIEGEPPEYFFYPVGEHLGGALLRAHRYVEAEAVFRTELARFPDDPRDQFGLSLALDGQGKNGSSIRAAAQAAWARADAPLALYAL